MVWPHLRCDRVSCLIHGLAHHPQADAREAGEDRYPDKDEDVRGEVKLVQLLRLGGPVRHSYTAWLPRLLAVVVLSSLLHFFSFLFVS